MAKSKLREQFCVFKGDQIVVCCETRELADIQFNEIPVPKRPTEMRSIYKLVKEDIVLKRNKS
jgi:hypothetical protein